MKKNFLITAVLSIILVFLSGCRDKNGLSPSDTLMGRNGANGHWDNEENLCFTQHGLEHRHNSACFTSKEVFDSIYFDFDNKNISASERTKLTKFAKYLQENPNKQVLLEGHCDWYGTMEYNIALGDKRAKSVLNFLDQLMSDTTNIMTSSKGSLDAERGLSKADAAKDRRVDLIVGE